MSLEKTLLAVAMESGEVPKPESFDLPPRTDSEEIEDYMELVESNADEINRSFEVVSALESLAKKYEGQDVTESSMESYRADIGMVLAISGANIPTSVIVPSFEAASGNKETIGQKTKAVVEALIKWIKDRWEALKVRARQLMTKLTLRKAKADIQHKQFKTAAEEAAENVKCGAVPSKFVNGGTLDHEAFIKFIHASDEEDFKRLLRTSTGEDVTQKLLDSSFATWHAKMDGETTSSYTVTRGVAIELEDALYNAAANAKFAADTFTKNVNTGNDFYKTLSAFNHVDVPTREIVEGRKKAQEMYARYSAQAIFATKVAENLFKLHSAFAHFGPGVEEKKDEDK
jgi:hypothetical protein